MRRHHQRMHLSSFLRGVSTEEEEPVEYTSSEEEDEDQAQVVLPSYPQLHEVSFPIRPPPDIGADEQTKAAYEQKLLAYEQYGKFHEAARIRNRYRDIEMWLWQMQCHQAAEFKHSVAKTLKELHDGEYKTDPGEEHAWVQCKVTEADEFSACVRLNENDERILWRLRKDNLDPENPVPEKRHTENSWWDGWMLEVEGHKEVVFADDGEIKLIQLSDYEELFTGTLHLLFPGGRPQRLRAPKSLRIRPVDFIRPAINHYKSTVSLRNEVAQATVCKPVKDLLCQIANPTAGPGQKAQDNGLKGFTCVDADPGSFNGIIANLPGGLSAMQGPPGTGKSTAVKTIITERVPGETKALVVCVKNKAVDAVVDKLKDAPGGVVVFGSKRNLGPEAVKHCYDLKAEQHPEWVNWVSLVRQLRKLRVSLKKSKDAQNLHHCSVPRNSSAHPSQVSKEASKASGSPEKGRNKLSDLEICQELCFTGTAPNDSISDEEEDFMGGGADSDDEAELAGMAAPEGENAAGHSGESPDMLTSKDHSPRLEGLEGPFAQCLGDDPCVSVSDIKGGIMLDSPSIPCGPKVWKQSWRSPVEVLLSLRDALLLRFTKLGEPDSRDKTLAVRNLQSILTEFDVLASSPQKLRTAAEEQQFELDRLDHFMAWLTDDAVGGNIIKKVGGHVMRDVLAKASAIMSTIDTVPNLFNVLGKCKSKVGRSIKTVIIDEAGCVPEYELPILLDFSPMVNLILVGDHHQLPCFSNIREGSQEKLGIKYHSRSLLERMVDCGANVPMLVLQYRMAEQISDVVSNEFYQGRLLTGTIAPQSRLQACTQPLRWVEAPIASAGQSRMVTRDPQGSRHRFESNSAEAELAMGLAVDAYDRLLHQGASRPTIYIIAPYNRQVDLLEELLKERRDKGTIELEVELAKYNLKSWHLGSKDRVQDLLTQRNMNEDLLGRLQDLKYQLELEGILVLTVDKAQGSEADVVVLSTVKCGNFTQDPRRMCVALSRARHQSILVGNSAEMQKHPMWARVISAYKQGA